MNAAEKVAQHLRKRITLGGFAPGTRLPTERELAETLGVSRNTVRDAIRALANEKVVETTRGRGGGSRVLPFSESGLRGAEGVADEFREFISDHMEYRALIEPAAARLAAERGSEEDRRKLVDLLRSDVPDLAAYHRVDTEFHLLIAHACQNPVLQNAILDARAELFVGGNVLWLHADWHEIYGAREHLSDVFRLEHASIAAAIMAGDGDASSKFMQTHLDEAAQQFRKLIANLES